MMMANPMLKKLRPRMENLLNKYKDTNFPTVDVITATMRPEFKEAYVAKLNSQTVKLGNVIICAEKYSNEDKLYILSNVTNGRVKFLDFDPDMVSLGERHNLMVKATNSSFIAIVDDDDIYLPNYLRGQLATLAETKRKIVAKANPICYRVDLDKYGFLTDDYVAGTNRRGAGGSIVFGRDVWEALGGFADVPVGYDSTFLHQAVGKGYSFVDGLPFNFAVTRGLESGHTWDASTLSFKDVERGSTSVEELTV